MSKIQELEGELLRLKKLSNSKRNQFVDYVDSDDDDGLSVKNNLLPSLNELSANSNTKAEDISGDICETLTWFNVYLSNYLLYILKKKISGLSTYLMKNALIFKLLFVGYCIFNLNIDAGGCMSIKPHNYLFGSFSG